MNNTRNSSNMLEAALWYLRKGYPVIPCESRTKKALVRWDEFKHKPPTETQVRSWWTKYPEANIALLLGSVSGIIALDVDDMDYINDRPSPETVMAVSGNKRLPHYFFKHVPGMENSHLTVKDEVTGKDKERFSIRCKDQYIIVPPSKADNGARYEWLDGFGIHEFEIADAPDWILERTLDNPSRDEAEKYYKQRDAKFADGLREYIETLKSKVRLSELLRYCGVEQTETKSRYIQFNCPFHDSEGKKSLTVWDDIGVAKDWHDDKNYDCIGFIEAYKKIGFKDAINYIADYAKVTPYRIDSLETKEESSADKIISLSDYKPKEMKWLLQDAIPEKYPTVIYGDGGLGKSYLALLLATLATLGKQTFSGLDFSQEPVNVLYVDYELDPDEVGRRAEKIANGLGIKGVPKNLMYYSPEKSLPKLLPELKRIIEAKRIQFLIIDSLSMCGVDPDNAKEMIEVISQIKTLGIATLILDHQSKMQVKDNYNTKTPYGTVFKYNLARSVFQLSRIGDKSQVSLMLRHTKSNFGRQLDDIKFDISFEGDRVQFYQSKTLSPDDTDKETIHQVMAALEQRREKVNQKALINGLKGTLGKDRIVYLLEKGEGIYWNKQKGDRTERLYKPLEIENARNLKYIEPISQISRFLNDNSKLSNSTNPECEKSENADVYIPSILESSISEPKDKPIQSKNSKPKNRVARITTHNGDYFYRFNKPIFEDMVSEVTVHPGHEDWELCEDLYEWQESRGNGHLKE